MITIQNGNCSKCGAIFGHLDTVQSTNVECTKCKKKVAACSSCKKKGCDCGGKFLDAWDKNPGIMF